MQTAVRAPKLTKRTVKDSHCLEMSPDTCRLINRIFPAGFTCISLATLDFNLTHPTAFFGQRAPYRRSSDSHIILYYMLTTFANQMVGTSLKPNA